MASSMAARFWQHLCGIWQGHQLKYSLGDVSSLLHKVLATRFGKLVAMCTCDHTKFCGFSSFDNMEKFEDHHVRSSLEFFIGYIHIGGLTKKQIKLIGLQMIILN